MPSITEQRIKLEQLIVRIEVQMTEMTAKLDKAGDERAKIWLETQKGLRKLEKELAAVRKRLDKLNGEGK